MSFSNRSTPLRDGPGGLGTAIERLRHRWGFFVAFGVLVGLLGLAALGLVVSATIASVYTIAIFMIIAGGAEIVTGFGAQSWGRFFLWILAGLCYIVVGAFALAQPLVAAALFTLMLGAGMVATGVVRIYIASQLGPGHRGLVMLAGAVTALVGLLIILGWPANSFFILGILLGLDLFFWGASWIVFGLRLRRHADARG
ncbi:MAG TPA: DUF308 domain-containing protein [Beijerinckia sp.]|jgi:uncharacterized membrane protein HdeD (DUF308 family)|nr:DUF308 domain-containing protein [Beijerinckia sp.]